MEENNTLGQKTEKNAKVIEPKGGIVSDICEWAKTSGWKVGLGLLASLASFGFGYKLGTEADRPSEEPHSDIPEETPFDVSAETEV